MRKIQGWIVLSIALIAWVGCPTQGQARALSAKNRVSIQCAREKMRIMAEFFDVHLSNDKKEYELPAECGGGRVRKVSMPKWFADELTRMDANKVVYIPNEGTYSEVDLWRQAFSNVYLFLNRADESLDPNKPIVLDQLSRGYVGNRINLMATLVSS